MSVTEVDCGTRLPAGQGCCEAHVGCDCSVGNVLGGRGAVAALKD